MVTSSTPPQINISKISGDGSIAGAIFTIASMLIFLIGIPALRFFLPAAIALGCIFAFFIYLVRRINRHENLQSPGFSKARQALP